MATITSSTSPDNSSKESKIADLNSPAFTGTEVKNIISQAVASNRMEGIPMTEESSKLAHARLESVTKGQLIASIEKAKDFVRRNP